MLFPSHDLKGSTPHHKMTFFNDDLCPSDYLTDDEIDELNDKLDRQDLENSIPDAAERNRYLT